jgi:signal peptidase I
VTSLELLTSICVLAIVRVGIGVLPASVSRGTKRAWRPVVREYLDSFIVAGLVAMLLITFVVRTFYIPSASMEPTLQVHDILLVDEFEYRLHPPHNEDIAVFTPPVPSPDSYIKRVMASPGDTLRIHGGIVYRNGIPLEEVTSHKSPITSWKSGTTAFTSMDQSSIRRARISRHAPNGVPLIVFPPAVTS